MSKSINRKDTIFAILQCQGEYGLYDYRILDTCTAERLDELYRRFVGEKRNKKATTRQRRTA